MRTESFGYCHRNSKMAAVSGHLFVWTPITTRWLSPCLKMIVLRICLPPMSLKLPCETAA